MTSPSTRTRPRRSASATRTSAARAFAAFVGYTHPVFGEFQQGDARSGEIEVRAFAEGAPSVVLLRQLEDDAWYVIGVSTDSIRLTTPQIGDTLTSPQPLEGQAYAFEGNVQVRLYADGVQEPIGDDARDRPRRRRARATSPARSSSPTTPAPPTACWCSTARAARTAHRVEISAIRVAGLVRRAGGHPRAGRCGERRRPECPCRSRIDSHRAPPKAAERRG